MPRAFTQNYYHMVFSTKDRAEWITPDVETRLYPFMGGILRALKCSLLAINGTPDHVHLLAHYPADLSNADMLRHAKSRSTKWLRQTFPSLRQFSWQTGYGGFTVSKSATETVARYIANQKNHHRKRDFKSEFLELLQKHEIEFDPNEVFD